MSLLLVVSLTLQACGGGGGGGAPANRPPVLSPIGARSMAEGATLTIEATATDPDGNAITYDSGSYPPFVSFAALTGGRAELRITPSFAEAGSYPLTVRVRDTAGATDEETFTLTVTDAPGNRAPVLAAIGNQSVAEGQVLPVTLTATDPDNDGMTLSATGLPAFATLTDNGAGNGSVLLAPGYADSGSYPVTVRVTDTAGASDEETFTLTVTDVPGPTNRAPVLAAIGSRSVAEGQVLPITLTATDPDNDGMTLSATGLPAFATLTDNGAGNGSLLLAPGYADSGSYAVTVRVTDTGAPSLTDTETLTITVTNANRAPQIAALDDQQVAQGATITLPISATDADGDSITLSRTAGPSFATVTDNGNGAGTLRLAPDSTDNGTYTVTIRATDNGAPSAFDEESLAVTVITTNNQVALENQLPGTSAWQLTNPAESRQIEGFASATSVDRGDTIALYVNTAAATFQLEVFRMGWYQGLGGRRVSGPVTVNGTAQTVPSPNATTGLVDAHWINPYLLDTEFSSGEPWRTGVYLAKLTTNPGGEQSYIIFVVRDDEQTPEVLFGLPVTTYQSYNPWGGKSLYPTQSGSQQPWGSTPGTRAVKVSFNRPYAASIAPSGWYGVGAGEFLTNTQPLAPNPTNYPVSPAGWDYNMVRWLEYEQYDVGYVTNVDYHRTNAHLSGIEVFLSPGHDEYWTWQMFDNVEDARDAGIDLAFLSANTAYRQIRFESSNNSVAPGASPEQSQRIMVHYREQAASADPVLIDGDPNNNYLATIEFRNSPVNRPEQDLLGVQYVLAPVDGDIVISNASHAVFARTGLSNGSRLVGLLGYEVDQRFGGFGSVVELASSPFSTLPSGAQSGTSHMTIYTAASGAQVFATGSIQWSWGLDDYNSPSNGPPNQGPLRTSRLSAAAQQITDNVLERFGATPYMPGPVSAQCVQLRALSNTNGQSSWASAAEIDLLGADGRELAKTQWTITADSQETVAENHAATNAIDGNVNTFWHSAYSSGLPPLPHILTIDLSATLDVSALRYLPRQDGNLNGTIGSYEVWTTDNCAAPAWTRVAQGTWVDTPTPNAGRKTARLSR